MRLQAYISKCGFGSRRECEKLILQGRVSINGRTIEALGVRVEEGDNVSLDGKTICPEEKVYLVLNKPVGYLCSNKDEKTPHPLALELIQGHMTQRLFHVGRLDLMSSGLIFYSNDGEFTNIITHPSYEVEKDYLVETFEDIPLRVLNDFTRGVTLEGVKYKARKYEIVNNKKIKLTLLEGKNREIRRFFAFYGIGTHIIHRIRIGTVTLSKLKPGEFRFLESQEIEWFLKKKGKK